MLPENWINKIFSHMAGLYGSKFADLWKGTDLEDVKHLWAKKLGGFADQPNAIKQALDALDAKPFPPTLPEFLTMCREAGQRGLDAPKALPHYPTPGEIARAEEAAQKVLETVAKMPSRDHLAWAKDLKRRHESGEKLAFLQVKMYREALGIKASA